MMKQKGQALVGFAFVAMFLCLLLTGLIYGGFAYVDYLQYNNAARSIAREVAIQEESRREAVVAYFDGSSYPPASAALSEYIHPLTKLYTARFQVVLEDDATADTAGKDLVKVTISLTPSSNTPTGKQSFLPSFGDINYTMRLEDSHTTASGD